MIFQLNVLMVYSVLSHLPYDSHVQHFSNSIQILFKYSNTYFKYLKKILGQSILNTFIKYLYSKSNTFSFQFIYLLFSI